MSAAAFLLLNQVLRQTGAYGKQAAPKLDDEPEEPWEPPPPAPPGAHITPAMIAAATGQTEEAVRQWIKENT
jgi:hypothetical protein